MASQLSSILDIVASLQESARFGDWTSTGRLAAILSQQTLPDSREELGEYLRCLKQALIAAKVSRAHSAASLARVNTAAGRLNAAARFNKIRGDPSPSCSPHGEWQEFGEAADS
jgi:hypothetical protein